MTGRSRSGGGAGRSTRVQRRAVGRARRNANPRPLVLTNASLAALDIELLEQDDGAQSQEELLLACPFYKHDPLRHRECIKYNLTSVNYVKQHLHRCHGLPPYCPTCYDKFDDTDSCNAHIVTRVCTGPAPGVERPVGVDAAQRSELNRRVPRTLTTEDQWLQVYHILFGQDAPRPTTVFKGDPIVEVAAAIEVIWKNNARAIIDEALAVGLSGPDAHMLLANAAVKGLLELTLSLESLPSSQVTQPSSQVTSPPTFSRATTALNSQVAGGVSAIKSENSQMDNLQPVPLDPDLFTPVPLAHNNNPHVDNTYLGLDAVAAATYNPSPAATPTFTPNHGPAPTFTQNHEPAPTFTHHGLAPPYTADPMTIDSPKPYSYITDLAISPSPEPEPQAGPSRPPRRKRKTPTSLSASSRSGSLDSAMTLDSPTFNGWRVGF